MGGLSITGISARVAWSYATAAEVRHFSISTERKQSRVRATVVSADPYALTQSGLVFVSAVGRWPIDDITVTDGVLRGRLGQRVK